MRPRRAHVRPAVAAAVLLAGLSLLAHQPASSGIQDPAWAPDGRALAFSWIDRIWIADRNGRGGRALGGPSGAVQRDPAWSRDGRSIAFAADEGDGFHICVATREADSWLSRRAPRGDLVAQVTRGAGADRWPAWTHDGRLIFSRRDGWRWRLYVAPAGGGEAAPLFADTEASEDEREARVSPDGKQIAYLSTRDSDDGDVDLWVADLPAPGSSRTRRTRVVRARGMERFPSWAPDGRRVAFYAVREGAGSVWAATVDRAGDAPRPAEAPVLVSRHGGVPAWAPDGRRIAIADLPPPEPVYNGNPLRTTAERPPLFAPASFRLWFVDAPLPVDSGARVLAPPDATPPPLVDVFDRVWRTLRELYYREGPSAPDWRALREKHRPRAEAARDEASLEDAIDAIVAEQPLIKPAVSSTRAVVVAGHPLATDAGVSILERGGNVVDAAVAVSFALGVVEPDASGIGGDGMALLYLRGMPEPVVVDFKDQVPIKATRDNPLLQQSGGDGPAAANIPGVVAGLDLMHRRYGSGRVSWADAIAPAIRHAEEGFVLDAALPTSIAEGRRFFDKYPASGRIYLPGGRIPVPGERFVNADYAATLRAIARDGAASFYRGAIAKRIADDMARNGGLITLDDLAQYRAIERRPLAGSYRGHPVYSSPPPVPTGLGLIETLHILQQYKPRPGAVLSTDADFLHHAVEAWKARDQGPRIADPALFDVDLGAHLDPERAAALFKRIDPLRASPYSGAGAARGSNPGAPSRGGEPRELQVSAEALDARISTGTTAFAVADAEGNMVVVTQTLSTWGGTFYVSEGLGFLYNNHLRFAAGGAPGRLLPLARSSTASAPTMVFRAREDGTRSPWLGVAAAGNAWIPASVYSIVLNMVDSGFAAQRAIEAPRFLVGRDPVDPDVGRVQIEDRFPRAVIEDLASRGHRFQKIGGKGEVRYGYAAVVAIDTARREVHGGAEPRRSHSAGAPRQ